MPQQMLWNSLIAKNFGICARLEWHESIISSDKEWAINDQKQAKIPLIFKFCRQNS